MSEPTHKLSAIPRCRKCGSDETYFYHRPGVQDGHSFEPMGEPVASPQATFGNTGTADYNGIGVKVTVPSEPSAAQPVAGTTPQAELLALRKKFKDEHMLNKHDSDRSEELIEIICEARAVAPVETPEVELCQICHRENPVWFAPNAVWNAVVTKISGILCPICFIKRAEQQGFRCTGWELVPELVNRPTDDKTPVGVGAPANLAPAQTRLTAEQLAVQIVNKFTRLGLKGRTIDWEVIEDEIQTELEAFRDKSEAGLREQLDDANYLVSLYRKNVPDLQTEAAGLREENERLKEGERLVRDFLERDYGVSEITTICSRYDDAEQELTELRAKLAEQERSAEEKMNLKLLAIAIFIVALFGAVWSCGLRHP